MKLYLTLEEYWVEVIQSKMLVVVAKWIFDAIRCKCAFAVPSSHLWCEFIFQISCFFTNFPVFSKILRTKVYKAYLWESYDLFSFLKRVRFFLINGANINYCKQEPGFVICIFAFWHLRPKGESAKVEMASSEHHSNQIKYSLPL